MLFAEYFRIWTVPPKVFNVLCYKNPTTFRDILSADMF